MAVDTDLLARMDTSLLAYWGAYAQTDGSHHAAFPGAHCLFAPIPHCLFNSVVLTADVPASVEAAFADARRRVDDYGTPVLWRLSAPAASDRLRAQLAGGGLERVGSDPAMRMDMSVLPPAPPVGGLTIRRAEGRTGRHDWAWLACEAFELADDLRDPMARCEAAIPEDLFESQPRYVGYLDGEPVAVSSLVMAADLAGIYAVATLPAARGRGIGTAMTLHAMTEGRRRGAQYAVLQATPMGRPVYERLGFAQVHAYETYLQH